MAVADARRPRAPPVADGELIEENGDELAALETADQGQPMSVSPSVSSPLAAQPFRYYAGWCTKIEG